MESEENMTTFISRFRNSLRSTSGNAYVARTVFCSDAPVVRFDVHAGRIPSAVVLTSRGSVSLSRLPVVDEKERSIRLRKMAEYDFSPHI